MITGKTINKDSVFKILLGALLAITLASVGLFHEWTSCAAAVLISIWLFARIIKLKDFSLNINATSVLATVLVFMYGISVFWAADKGMAFVGFLKFLPVLLFCLSLFVESGAEAFIKRYLPVFIAALVVVCASLMQIPALKDYFSVAGRFSGSFQYPNTFALVALIAELLVFSSSFKRPVKIILALILLFGLIYTGSRTVFILAIIANVCMIFSQIKFSKKAAYLSLAVFFAAVAVSLILAFVGVYPFDRILTIKFTESTFVGRLLYFKDAAPVILKHPFGLGYLGYFYTQTTFQTGIYSVKYIHNDILQIALDIGWIPAALFVFAVIKSIFSKGVPFENRVILSVIFLHSLFDFDLQFVAVFMLTFVFMKRDSGKTVKTDKAAPLFVITLLSLLSLYFSVALGLYSFGKNEAADDMYPYNTDNKIKMLMISEE
ncbi:MAG: O-antigen ligase family protein, partial [Clostridia bacterium]|nr:O-antigen ligase family protein [Clostridia bacterium]